jgi:hypothetical protein
MALADGGKTPKAGTKAAPAQGNAYSAQSFAEALLQRLGVPVSPENVDFITSWEAAEGGHWNNSATYNPLNTTLHMPGSGPMGGNPNQNGGDPVQAYTSWQQGLDATVNTITHSRYSGIIQALHANNPQAAAQAAVNSGWGTHNIQLGSGAHYGTTATADTGGTNSPGTGTDTPGTVTNQKDIAAQFGYSSAFFNSDPSLKALIDKYAGQDSTNATVIARFQADLMDTPWFQKHTKAQREWTQLQTSDPTEAAHQLLTMQQQLAQQAKQAGVALSGSQLQQMAKSALSMYGANVPSSVVQQMIGAQVHYKGGNTYQGDVGNDVTTLKDLATSYGVPLSDKTMQGWLQNIVTNGVDPKSYTQYLQQQSESLYPTLAPQLKQGLTFQQAVDPYRQIGAQLTDTDPNTIDFTQPKWQKAIMQVDPKTGDRTAMSLDQWQTTLKSDPVYGYATTTAGKQEQSTLAKSIASMLGATG